MTDKTLKEVARDTLGELSFRHPWRAYQARVLSELQSHLTDERLHIVAAPGSGKTVLGLEVIRQLKVHSLVLVPSLAIREQWVQRFCDDFTLNNRSDDTHHSLVNRVKQDDAFIKIETYQWLHQQAKRDDFTFSNYQLVVLDEAHHLTQAWWRSLETLVEQLKDVKLVALTATPPLGASAAHWNRYRSLCGPIDAEISIPELVKTGDLCPHQDYLLLTKPDSAEQTLFDEAHTAAQEAISLALDNKIVKRALLGHPYIGNCRQNLSNILRDSDLFTAMLSYLQTTDCDLAGVYAALSLEPEKQAFTASMLETLLNHLLREPDDYFLLTGDLERLHRQFSVKKHKRAHVFRFHHTEAIEKILLKSRSKLHGIHKIVDHEYNQLGKDLRCLVLTTYIRQHYTDWPATQLNELDQLGVVPIALSQLNGPPFAAICGSMAIIPGAISDAFPTWLSKAVPLNADPRYLVIEFGSDSVHDVLPEIVKQYRSGSINVLISTTSLLGEGWDEPSVNTLILASQSRSYVQVNQLRGRAIRINRDNPNKTANIWHIACTDPGENDLGLDAVMLRERFQGVVGLHHHAPLIVSGFERVTESDLNQTSLSEINTSMLERSAQRSELQQRWAIAMGDPSVENRDYLQERLLLPAPREQTSDRLHHLPWRQRISSWIKGFFGKSYERQVNQFAQTLLVTLQDKELINPNAEHSLQETADGLSVLLNNASKYEQETYLLALSELVTDTNRTRFVIAWSNELFYVPAILQRKADAELLLSNWQKHLGKAQLIYARTLTGQRQLMVSLVHRRFLTQTQPIRQAIWLNPSASLTHKP